VQIAVFRAWADVVGVAHKLPLTVAYGALHVAVAALVFAIARRRVGDWAALGVALLVLFLGRGWETLMFPGALSHLVPTLAACVAWAALDRDSRRWEIGAAAALAVAVLAGGAAPAVLAGLTAEIALRRDWRRLWVVAAGVLPLLVWTATEAGERTYDLGANLRALPEWAAKLVAAAAGALVGLPPVLGAVVLAAALAAVVLWRRRGWWTPRAIGLAVTLAVAVVATGAVRAETAPPTSSRYLYFLPVVLALLAVEALRGVALPRATAALVALAVVLGVAEMRDGKVFWLRNSDATAARMGALELVRDEIPRGFQYLDPSRLRYGPAVLGAFRERYGAAPFHRDAELREALPESRTAADEVLAYALVTRARAPRVCEPAPVRGDRILVARAPFVLRRYGDGVPLEAGAYLVRDGGAPAPWKLGAGAASVRRCAARR
jgi:hypothetical protein